METPRGSGYQDLPREKIIQFGKDLGLETERDEIGNVMIRKPATPGYENKPSICFQVHYDMVCVADEGYKIDFTKEPLKPRIVDSPDPKHGKYAVMAIGTSLGSDDGIGDAIVLNLLADKEAKHGPIEALFTCDEETTMEGATNIKPGFIKSKYLVNVDSEENWRICIGCAGGFEGVIDVPLVKEEKTGVPVRIEMKKLLGGHSGVMINEGHANALKLLHQIVSESIHEAGLDENFNMDYFVGGDKHNVIPNAARAGVLVPKAELEKFLAAVNHQVAYAKEQWKNIEKSMEIIVTHKEEEKHLCYDLESSKHFLFCMAAAPHGVLRMSPSVEGLVESSINLAKVVLCDKVTCKSIHFEFFARSSDNPYMNIIYRNLVSLSKLFKGTIQEMGAPFPGWLPDRENPLLDVAVESYKEVYHGEEPEIYAIHAGLECGMFMRTYPDLKCISVGPYLINGHSPQETLFIDSVVPSYKLLTTICEKIH